ADAEKGDAEAADATTTDAEVVAEVQSDPDVEEVAETASEADADAESDEFSTVFGVSEAQAETADDEGAVGEGDELPVADAIITGERPIVRPTFGTQVLGENADVPAFSPSFDELITSDSGGSHR